MFNIIGGQRLFNDPQSLLIGRHGGGEVAFEKVQGGQLIQDLGDERVIRLINRTDYGQRAPQLSLGLFVTAFADKRSGQVVERRDHLGGGGGSLRLPGGQCLFGNSSGLFILAFVIELG